MKTSPFLSDKEVKERFLQEFIKPHFRGVKVPLLAEPQTKNYALVGTAFDYLLRFYLQHLNPKAVARPWVAETAVLMLEGHPWAHKKAKIIRDNARNHLEEYLVTGEISNKLLNSTILLAKLDSYSRVGIVDEAMDKVDNRDVDDLSNLLAAVPETFTAKETCILNPTFGEASSMMGGADADLIIDDVLIDIKTTKHLKFSRVEFNQIINYYVLYRIAGVDGLSQEHEIKKLGIYFSRHGYLHTVDVEEIIDENKFPAFVDWFKKKAADSRKSLKNHSKSAKTKR